MKCPECKSPNSLIRTIGTKADAETFNHRYIECTVCLTSWQSAEYIMPDTVVKRSAHIDQGHLFESIVNRNKPAELKEK